MSMDIIDLTVKKSNEFIEALLKRLKKVTS